jgi:hypothetical protein
MRIEMYRVKNSKGKFLTYKDRKITFMFRSDALDFLELNKNNGEVYELVRVGRSK